MKREDLKDWLVLNKMIEMDEINDKYGLTVFGKSWSDMTFEEQYSVAEMQLRRRGRFTLNL